MSQQAGIIVGGFELSHQIGEGAFSKVYQGTSSDPTKHALHATVAIKVLRLPPGGDQVEQKKKVLKEVRLHKALAHKNILRLLSFTEDAKGGSIWIVLEYAHGGDLFDKISPDIGISEELAHLYFFQLIAALNYCHNSGIVHRDIKPENMLLDQAGNLKLADFGLADLFRYQGKEKKCVEACGSAPYAAPELALGTPYRAQPIDVWSAGVVLFTLLVGNTPWDQPTSASPEYSAFLTGELLEQDPWTRLPMELRDLLLRILHPNPKERAKISDIAQHPWFQLANPHLEKGMVANKDDLWNALLSQLDANGEFTIKSAFSDESEDSQMSSDSQAKPSLAVPGSQVGYGMGSPLMPVSSMPRSQGRSRNVFDGSEMEMSQGRLREDTKTTQQRRGEAETVVRYTAANKAKIEASMRQGLAGIAGTASQFSQCYAVAPSQIANPNLSRFFSYWNLPSIVAAIRNALQELGIELMYDVQPAGAAIRFKTYDKRGERLTGSFNIEYEATEDDYAAIAPEASIRDLAKQRKGALAVDENDEDVTIQPGGHHSPHHGSAVSDVALGRGVGQGGYVVKLYTKGDPLEKKRLFREVELRMPQGLIYAR